MSLSNLALWGGALALLGALILSGCGGEEDGDPPPGCVSAAECGVGFMCTNGMCGPAMGTTAGCANSDDCVPPDDTQRGICVSGGCQFVPITEDDTGMVDDGGDEDTDIQPDTDDNDVSPDTETTDTSEDPDTSPDDVGDADVSPDDAGDVTDDTMEEDMGPPDVPAPDVAPFEGCLEFGCPGLRICDEASDTCVESDVCIDNRDCDEGRSCLQGSCSDQQVNCVSNEDCPNTLSCITRYGECEGLSCESDADCAGPRRCSAGPGQRFCVSCLESSECPGNQVCPAQGGQCAENVDGCTGDMDCTGSRVCTGNTCITPMCQPDMFEGNTSAETAAALPEGESELTFCLQDGGEGDWFSFDLDAGDSFVITVEYDASLGQSLQMELLADDQRVITSVPDANQSGFIILAPQAPATEDASLYLRIRPFNQGSANYTLNFRRIPGGICLDDTYEPDDTLDASNLLDFSNSDGFLANLCAGDMDWFTQRLEFGETLTVTITTLSGQIPSVDLFESNVNTFLLRDTRPQEVKVLTYRNSDSAADYFIRVFPDEPEDNSEYLILIEVE